MTLPLARPPTFKWCRRPHRLSALLHSPCARQVSPFVFSFWFVYPFSHILIICLPNHTNSYSQFNEHPSCSSLPPQVWPGKKVCSFKHNSHVRAMYWYFFSPPPLLVWHARGKHTLCIHQSQTASDRGYSATVARYVKCPGMSFSLSGARVICKYNGSGLHGFIQSKASI